MSENMFKKNNKIPVLVLTHIFQSIACFLLLV